jgi:hypothetical protein
MAIEIFGLKISFNQQMEKYKNLSGNSGVLAFETGEDYIKVKFKEGPIYTYDYTSTGRIRVEKMKLLALKGKGLSTYISRKVKNDYSNKI